MTKESKTCRTCVYFDWTSVKGHGECNLKPGERVKYEDKCDNYVSVMIFAKQIDRLAAEEPFLKLHSAAERISEKFNGRYTPKFVEHLIRSKTSHEPVYKAWQRYIQNRDNLIKKEKRERRIKRKKEKQMNMVKKKIELGIIPDPNGPTPLQEAREIIDSGQVCELCELIGIDCGIVKDQRTDVLKIYKKMSKKRPKRRYRDEIEVEEISNFSTGSPG